MNQQYNGLQNFITDLKGNMVLLISNRDITRPPYVQGEDFYISSLVSYLKEMGIIVDIAIYSLKHYELYCKTDIISMPNLNLIIGNYDVVILHVISPFRFIGLKMKFKFKIVMPVVFIWNKAAPILLNMRWFVGIIFWQLFVDRYLVTSSTIEKTIRRLVLRKIYVVPPIYKCRYCDSIQNDMKLSKLQERLPEEVRVVYIGSINKNRFPFTNTINTFLKDEHRKYYIDIYTVSPIKSDICDIKNVHINYYQRILTDREKCLILQNSQLFIAPILGTTMDPPISIIEAQYHGNIIIQNKK